jgi:hypothetical protein
LGVPFSDCTLAKTFREKLNTSVSQQGRNLSRLIFAEQTWLPSVGPVVFE